MKERCKDLVGKVAVLTRGILLRPHFRFPKRPRRGWVTGAKVLVAHTWRGRFDLVLLTPGGQRKLIGGYEDSVSQVHRSRFELLPPAQQPKAPPPRRFARINPRRLGPGTVQA